MGKIQYSNRISLSYILNNEVIEILSEAITSMSIIHNYDTANMPVILMKIKLNYKIYDKIVNNINKGLFRLSLQRYNRNSNTSIKKDSINSLFTYIIPTNVEYDKELVDKKNDTDSYKYGTIALLSLDNINDNRNIYNGIIKNSNMISVVHKYTNHMNMIIEQFRSDAYFDQLIIPPISTLTRLLSYLDRESPFYDTRFRYFRDFNKTYLVSSSGNIVEDKDTLYNSMIIQIISPAENNNKSTGLDLNKASKSYILNIDARDTSMNIDISTDLQYNTIIGFDDSGDKTVKLNLSSSIREDNYERVLLKRKTDLTELNNFKNTLDSSSVVLNIVRSDIDSTILTPNKEYIVKNYNDYKKYNGKFLLSYKKEIFLQQGDDFVSSVVFGLRKVTE